MYRSLLVQLDGREGSSGPVDVALRMAQALDCHLVGLAPTGRLPVPMGGEPGLIGVEQAYMEAAERLRLRAEASAQRFEARCRAEKLPSFETTVDDEDVARSVIHHAHCSDLVIIGQAREGGDRGAVEQMVLQSARPVLVVPYAGRFETVGQNVLVSWNDSPESARAVADAMPLLCRARQVSVVRYEEPLGLNSEEMLSSLEALRRWLAWHGVEAQVQGTVAVIDVGNALLSHAADSGADLLVMGAYGHSRWSERILGGTTRTLLQSMTLPVLMSH